MYTNAGDRLRELFVFIAQDQKGAEDVLAVELDGECTPLICTTPEHAAALVPLAQRIIARMEGQKGMPHRIRLLRFSPPQDVTERFMHAPLSDALTELWEFLYPFEHRLEQTGLDQG